MAIHEVPPQEYPDIVGARPEEPQAAAFRPFIPASVQLPELTFLPLIVGTILGIIFGASSLYLVLKVGLTVSASIPVAVLSIAIFRGLRAVGLRGASILENNIVQTAGSAGESIAFGVGVTMPAIMILGFDLEITRVMLVAVLGGLLGILMMIPLRRALIVQQHGVLKYPEGTACAEVLKAGATDEERAIAARGAAMAGDAPAAVEATASGAKAIFTGFGIGLAYQTLMKVFYLWKETPEKIFRKPFEAGSISAEINPTLLGVGYIIGPRIASIMCAGGVLAYLVLIPAIKYFGGVATGVIAPGTMPISEMSPNDIRGAYVLYIGAGAVAAGGIISLFRSLPTIWHGLQGGLADFRGRTGAAQGGRATPRTDQDMSLKFVVGGIIALIAVIMLVPQLHLQWNLLGALLIIIFGFLFVTVSSRLTGEIGSSSNPISGMTVATLLLTCLVFLLIGWTGPSYYVTALSIGAIVCIAASNGGTTSQDLKTGFLVGATPRNQQVAILFGALASALVLGPILLKLNDSATVYVPLANPAGQIVAEGYSPDLRVDPGTLSTLRPESLQGPQATADRRAYHSWQKTDDVGGPAGRYLVNDAGVPVYLVDPGINGTHKERPGLNGTIQTVNKFDAPKATLMSYIIKGILNRQLPWGLVLLGVMISIVLEMSGIPSLAFAVGVYLPLSSSSPIFIGGLVRWMVDRHLKKKLAHRKLTEEELTAEGDKSPGVLMASGYIAGGAIAGIAIAFSQGLLTEFDSGMIARMKSNPFFEGGSADLLALIPFALITVLLYMAGREMILAGRKTR
ncbi:MAG TPA: oligopeptide transporter, OPT family [Thermoanaerobaculia bacterium]|jgi:putative OPT family oligopeptide transporter|nr:oligopeptide transporter, OPT family [Thermoanaerobaculia bacterium]